MTADGISHTGVQAATRPSPVASRAPSAEAAHQIARSRTLLPNGVSGRSALPPDQTFIAARGLGARIYDSDGGNLIDYHAGAGALILGHCAPSVVAAVQAQVALGSVFFGSTAPATLGLAERLVAASPCAEKVAFATTGSEATAYALRIARAATGRRLFLKFDGAYHGNQDVTQAKATSNDGFGAPETGGVPPDTARLALVAPYNDIEATQALARQHAGELAAIIVEPVQKHIFPLPGFLQGLRQLANDIGALLIFDEVVTGFRLAYGGAQSYFGVMPDLACYGKIIGGGYPLGAVTGPAALIDLVSGARRNEPGYVLLNGTHHGMPVAAAAGLATLEVVAKTGFHDALNAWTATLRRELQKIADRHATGVRIDGDASMWAITTLPHPPTCNADLGREDTALLGAIDRGLVAGGCYVLPGNRRLATAAHGDSELEDTLRAFDGACRGLS